MEWKKLRKEVYYADGSLRDIYVLDTNRQDWARWIDLVNRAYSVRFYDGKTAKAADKIDKKAVFAYWDKETDVLNSAVISVGEMKVMCYFFTEDEIENDISPKELNSLRDHENLMGYLIRVSTCLGKRIVLTPEDYSGEPPALIAVENGVVSMPAFSGRTARPAGPGRPAAFLSRLCRPLRRWVEGWWQKK